jgi:hypothetical protein
MIAALASLAFVSPVFALDPEDWKADTTDARSYERVAARYRDALGVYDYPPVIHALDEDLQKSRAWKGNEQAYLRLRRKVDQLDNAFSGFEDALRDAQQRGTAFNEFLTEFKTGVFQYPCLGQTCLADEDAVTYAEIKDLPPAQAVDFLQRLRTLSMLLTRFKLPATGRTVNAIHLAHERWQQMVEEGRSQYPWEALINGWIIGEGTIQQPPMKQLVVAHPSVAVEMTTEDIKNLRAKEALSVELLGLIRYHWKHRDAPTDGLSWWGVSGVMSLREDLRPGAGFLLHYGRMVTLGAVWHDDDEDDKWFDRPPYVIASVDLYQMAKGRIPEYQSRFVSHNALLKKSVDVK